MQSWVSPDTQLLALLTVLHSLRSTPTLLQRTGDHSQQLQAGPHVLKKPNKRITKIKTKQKEPQNCISTSTWCLNYEGCNTAAVCKAAAGCHQALAAFQAGSAATSGDPALSALPRS